MNMIEKVARAIAKTFMEDEDSGYSRMYENGIEREVDEIWQAWAGEARAAIEAMRKPTGEMIQVGVENCDCWEMSALEVGECWQAMIDAALNEK